MDSKGETSDLSYPNIFFLIDSYDEVRIAATMFMFRSFVSGLDDLLWKFDS